MELASLGWNASLQESFAKHAAGECIPARVAVEDKHHFVVLTEQGELSGHVAGKFLHEAASLADLPKVGDWVAVTVMPHEAKVVIHAVLPRRTKLSRKVPGRETEEQVLVTNVDLAFIVQALDGSFNAHRIQRHLVTVYESGAQPVVILNKIDLCETPAESIREAQQAVGETPLIAASALTGDGMEQLSALIRPGMTVVFIGSSGVGKSSLINRLYGEEIQGTLAVREKDLKGRHSTTCREMICLPNGALVIDTPGTREFHLWTADEGVSGAFPEIDELAAQCHFRDCQHTAEKQCAVREAVEAGQLSQDRCASYLKLRNEIGQLDQARMTRARLEKKRQTKIAQRAFNQIKRRSQDENEPVG